MRYEIGIDNMLWGTDFPHPEGTWPNTHEWLCKTFFDIALGGWIADHVRYERRGRVVGLTELSWAGGLLIGVPIMGLVAAATSWRGAYVVAGIAVTTLAILVRAKLDET